MFVIEPLVRSKRAGRLTGATIWWKKAAFLLADVLGVNGMTFLPEFTFSFNELAFRFCPTLDCDIDDDVDDGIVSIRIANFLCTVETYNEQSKSLMYEVGYSDVKAFREVFRRITGMSPLEYRGKYNKEATV